MSLYIEKEKKTAKFYNIFISYLWCEHSTHTHTLSLMANFVMDSKLKVGLEVEVDLMLSFWSDTKWMLMFPTINQRRQKPRTHKSIHHVLLKRENLWWLCIKLRRQSILYDASRMNYETQTHSIMSEKCLDESMIVECCAWNQQDN